MTDGGWRHAGLISPTERDCQAWLNGALTKICEAIAAEAAVVAVAATGALKGPRPGRSISANRFHEIALEVACTARLISVRPALG